METPAGISLVTTSHPRPNGWRRVLSSLRCLRQALIWRAGPARFERVYSRLVPEVGAEAERLWAALPVEQQVNRRLKWPGMLERARLNIGAPATYTYSWTSDSDASIP